MKLETTTQIKEVRDTIVILRELNEDEKVRQVAYYREKRLHDETTALSYAKREGEASGLTKGEAIGIEKKRQETIVKLREMGMSDEDIKRFLFKLKVSFSAKFLFIVSDSFPLYFRYWYSKAGFGSEICKPVI